MAFLPDILEPLEIIEVFEEHDFPCLFLCQAHGKQYLAVWIADGDDKSDWLYVELSPERMAELRSGSRRLREAYTQSENGKVLRISLPKLAGRKAEVTELDAKSLANDILPSPLANLTGDSAAVISIRTVAEIESDIRRLPRPIADAMGLFSDLKVAAFIESGSDARLAFDGVPVSGHEVDAGFFGRFWDKFQALFESTGRAMFGDIPISETRLFLGMTSPSSYAIDLRIPVGDNDGGNKNLFAQEPTKNEHRSMLIFDRVTSMILDESQTEPVIEFVNRHQSVRTHFGSILELISQRSATIFCMTRSNPSGRTITKYQAEDRLVRVRKLGYPYGFLRVHGLLSGGLVRKVDRSDVNFVLVAKDDAVYRGKIADDVIPKIKTINYDAEIVAKLQVEAANEKTPQTYTLVDFIPVIAKNSD